MAPTQVGEIDAIVERFREGALTEADLRQALERRGGAAKRQDLLYLQASSTAVNSSLLGITLIQGGEVVEWPTGAPEWPYANVLEAIRDGWRVIKFPELSLLLLEEQTTSLGCEFILEKWS